MTTPMPTRAAPAAALLALLATASLAEAPLAGAAAPGFHRVSIGAFEVTALSDGTVDLPIDQLLVNTTPEAVAEALAASFLELPLETSSNAFLVNTGAALVLVDAGAGSLFGPTLGRLAESLRASGHSPEEVDHVVLTHLHPDHVGGLATEGAMAFPEADVHVAAADADHWLSEANLQAAPEDGRGFFEGAQASLAPYVAAGRLQTFEGEAEIVPGLRVLPLPGHTDGHVGYVVESEDAALLIWGDVVHVAAVQFADPSVTIAFDGHPETAAAERSALFAQVAAEGTLVAGAHLPFPGLGHVRAEGGAYEWVPLPFGALQ